VHGVDGGVSGGDTVGGLTGVHPLFGKLGAIGPGEPRCPASGCMGVSRERARLDVPTRPIPAVPPACSGATAE
jgi:hypothetical protein